MNECLWLIVVVDNGSGCSNQLQSSLYDYLSSLTLLSISHSPLFPSSIPPSPHSFSLTLHIPQLFPSSYHSCSIPPPFPLSLRLSPFFLSLIFPFLPLHCSPLPFPLPCFSLPLIRPDVVFISREPSPTAVANEHPQIGFSRGRGPITGWLERLERGYLLYRGR